MESISDPMGAFENVRESLILYIKTAFRTQFPGFEREREELLRQPGVICQEPWIEPLPQYESSGKTIADLTSMDVPGLAADALEDFKALAACGLVGNYELRCHQTEMLGRALSGENCVVTAGTGSGKTEAFLLPLFAYLASESRRWSPPGARVAHQDDWWASGEWREQCLRRTAKQTRLTQSLRIPQRQGEPRPAAVRALIVYPMNALVEDQLSRLRKALDSPEARAWCADLRSGNPIYFGRYNGATPVPGQEYNPPDSRGTRRPNRQKIEELSHRLQQMEDAARAADTRATGTGDADVRYFFPRLDGAEMRSRWDMQDAPPDILITNFSMLSIMLMRDADRQIFEKTREWLREEGSVFHLIVDELHLYRGTAGTEVAYLMRLLLDRLGLSPDSPKLRILASSASLDRDDPKSLKYLSDFFGTGWSDERIIPGYPAPVPELNATLPLPTRTFANLGRAANQGGELLAGGIAQATVDLGSPDRTSAQHGLAGALESERLELAAHLLQACKEDGVARAVPVSEFGKRLFGSEVSDEERGQAVRGLLFARSLCDPVDSALPSFRLHWFFRNFEGLWSCTAPDCGDGARTETGGRTAGQLFSDSRILCRNERQKHRVLELLYCEQCGTTMFGGSRMEIRDGGGWELLTADPDIEGIPDRQAARFVERRTYAEFGVFWPRGLSDLNHTVGSWRQPTLDSSPPPTARWVPAALDTRSGRLVLGGGGQAYPEGPWIGGYKYLLDHGGDPERVGALPATCPRCAADYCRRKFRRSPIRGFRTGFSKLTQLLSKEMFHFLPDSARKLVVFSDSREEAAALANGIERSHHLDLVREAMYDELHALAVGEPALLRELEDRSANLSPDVEGFTEIHPGIKETLEGLIRATAAAVPNVDDPGMRALLDQYKRSAQRELDLLRDRGQTRAVPLRLLFESQDTSGAWTGPGLLIGRLKRLGVNPGGNDVLYQDYRYDGEYQRWTKLFDFSDSRAGWLPGLSGEAATARERLRTKVESEVCSVLFSRLYFGFESAGLGFPRLGISQSTLEQRAGQCGAEPGLFARICDATVRVLGDLYRYRQEPQEYPLDSWPSWDDARAKLRNFVKAAAAVNSLNETTLLGAVHEAVCIDAQHHDFILNPRHLLIRIALPADPAWICSGCQREHLHTAGLCTNCLQPLPPRA